MTRPHDNPTPVDARTRRVDRRMLDAAARAALRALGDVEPNPIVGCVIGAPDGAVLGAGHHRRFGGPHAEVEALRRCAALGNSPKGATAWVTLEPCNHTGKTPPCANALIDAGVSEVVYALPDPHPTSAGGASTLRAAGVRVRTSDASALALRIGEPFAHRIRTGRPWVVAKWAQTIDGRVATRTGESQWISCPRSRTVVHRLRARADAILTGIGTVMADDPMLTARGVRRIHRAALRIVIDPHLRTPLTSALVESAAESPLVIVTGSGVLASDPIKAKRLREHSVHIESVPDGDDPGIDLRAALAMLHARRSVSTILVEAGPSLLGRLIDADLVDEAWVFVAPMALADADAMPVAHGRIATRLAEARRYDLLRTRRVDKDALLIYRRNASA